MTVAEAYFQDTTMKIKITLLALGIVSVCTAPTQTSLDQLPLSEHESQGKQNEKISNQGETEQKTTTGADSENEVKHSDEKLEIIIKESFVPDDELAPLESGFIPQSGTYLDDVFEHSFMDGNTYHNSVNKEQDEIMETAAGFIPVPIMRRRKHASRRRFAPAPATASRRYFRKNPYFTPYYLYPYYGFYRPSSLRYY